MRMDIQFQDQVSWSFLLINTRIRIYLEANSTHHTDVIAV